MAVVFGLHLAASDRMSFFLTIKYNRLHENLDEGFFVHCLLASSITLDQKSKKLTLPHGIPRDLIHNPNVDGNLIGRQSMLQGLSDIQGGHVAREDDHGGDFLAPGS